MYQDGSRRSKAQRLIKTYMADQAPSTVFGEIKNHDEAFAVFQFIANILSHRGALSRDMTAAIAFLKTGVPQTPETINRTLELEALVREYKKACGCLSKDCALCLKAEKLVEL